MRATYFLAQAGEPVAVDGPAGGPGGGGLPGRCYFARLLKHLIDGWDPPQTLHLCTTEKAGSHLAWPLLGHAESGASGSALYRQGIIMLLELVWLNEEGQVDELTIPNLCPKGIGNTSMEWQGN